MDLWLTRPLGWRSASSAAIVGLALRRASASEVHPYGTNSLVSSERVLSFPRTSTAETE
jgi:thiazole synthase ThiGH ThiG subunit